MISVLTTAAMAASDQAAIAAGTPGIELMEAAGWQVARLVRQYYKPRKTLIFCGPGNNGGDGFVVARLLDRWGWPVTIALLGEQDKLRGDAAAMAARWDGPLHPLSAEALSEGTLIVDALFGAGLARPLEGLAKETIERIGALGLPVVAVDLPSGVNGDTARPRPFLAQVW